MKRIIAAAVGMLLLFFGISGLYFQTVVSSVEAGRAALATLVETVSQAEAAKAAAQSALNDANAAKADAKEIKTLERALKNAAKKAANKQRELENAQAASMSGGSAADNGAVRACAALRLALIALGAALCFASVRGMKSGDRPAAAVLGVLGAVMAAAGLALCVVKPQWSGQYQTVLGLIKGGLLSYRWLYALCGLTVVGVAAYADPKLNTLNVTRAIFLAPAVAAFLLTVIAPFFLGVYYSLTDWNGSFVTGFVGLANYMDIFKEPSFLHSFLITLSFTVLNMLFVNAIAFVLALLVTGRIRGRNFYRAGFFVPNLIGGIVLGYIWQFIFNHVTPLIGHVISSEMLSQSMLAEPSLAFAAILTVSVWQYAGYIMMIYVAAIQGVPDSVLEAAQVDGADELTRTLKIVLPMIANAVTVCVFLTLVTSFKQFDLNYALTSGGPATLFMDKAINSTEFLALNIYNTAFSRHQMALAQAKAVVFFLVLVAVSLLQVKAGKSKEVEM